MMRTEPAKTNSGGRRGESCTDICHGLIFKDGEDSFQHQPYSVSSFNRLWSHVEKPISNLEAYF
jgi:hypothetical protein